MAAPARRGGTITRLLWDKGFGFIAGDEIGDELFFHATTVTGTSFDRLRTGMRVTFIDRPSARGKRADHVAVAST
jgi:cold shock CspA family protein